jgi:hypothetical protein
MLYICTNTNIGSIKYIGSVEKRKRLMKKKRKGRPPVGLSGYDTLLNLRKLYSHTYLAIMSIVQGVALHILVYHSMEYWADIDQYGYAFILYFFVNLEILALLWFEYLYNMQFPRLANWKDTVLPIILGVLQITLTYNLMHPMNWYITLVAVDAIGYFAYRNTRIGLLPWRNEYQPYIFKYIENSQRKKELGTILLILVLVIFNVLYYSFYGINSGRLTILDCLWFVTFTYVTVIFFCISNRLEYDLRELDRDNSYKPIRLRIDVLFLEPLLEWCVKRWITRFSQNLDKSCKS